MRAIIDDVRQATRVLVKSPRLVAAMVLPLGLGIGAGSAIFGMIDAVLFRCRWTRPSALSSALADLLFGVAPRDPASFAVPALVLVAVPMLASYFPARRAARADPATALRQE